MAEFSWCLCAILGKWYSKEVSLLDRSLMDKNFHIVNKSKTYVIIKYKWRLLLAFSISDLVIMKLCISNSYLFKGREFVKELYANYIWILGILLITSCMWLMTWLCFLFRLFSPLGQEATTKAELPDNPDRVVCPFHESQTRHGSWWNPGRNLKETGRQFYPKTDWHWWRGGS